jgi:hypothetical protein
MKPALRSAEAAALIDRFVEGKLRYPQEWNDFIEAGTVEPRVEPFRRRCYELDPLVNVQGNPNRQALAELRSISKQLADLPTR